MNKIRKKTYAHEHMRNLNPLNQKYSMLMLFIAWRELVVILGHKILQNPHYSANPHHLHDVGLCFMVIPFPNPKYFPFEPHKVPIFKNCTLKHIINFSRKCEFQEFEISSVTRFVTPRLFTTKTCKAHKPCHPTHTKCHDENALQACTSHQRHIPRKRNRKGPRSLEILFR